MAKIAAAAHAPFIAAAGPTLMQMESWQELANPRDLTKIFTTPEYAAWRSLRESDDARYIGLAMPRFLARMPYGAKTNPVEEFDFEEDTDGADHTKYTWANAAYAMAVNINRSFKLYGWCSRIRGIESGGAVEGLPTHTFPTDDGGVDMKCPTEIAISDRREAELAKNGFMPLIHRKNSDFAAFIGAQSLQKPAEYDDPDATANANLAARLPYLFATCRFAHYLKCIVRDKIGSFKERDDMASVAEQLDHELRRRRPGQLVGGRPRRRSRSPRPRSWSRKWPATPATTRSKFFLRPHYQLEGPHRVAAAGVQAAVAEAGLNECRWLHTAQPATVSASLNFKRSFWRKHMSTDTACQFDGVEGESTRKGLKKFIEVMSWRWGVSQPSGGGAGGGSGKGKAVPGDFEFTHAYDKASPVLAKACAAGKHFPKVVFKSSKAGEGQKTFLEITMKEVLVTSVQPGGSAGGDITEHVGCSYKDIEFAYKPQDDKGGLGGEVKFGWNLATLETR